MRAAVTISNAWQMATVNMQPPNTTQPILTQATISNSQIPSEAVVSPHQTLLSCTPKLNATGCPQQNRGQ